MWKWAKIFQRLKFLKKKIDIYITGDITYHYAQEMFESGIIVLDVGHYIEKKFENYLLNLFIYWKNKEKWNINLYTSGINTDPFKNF